VFLPHGIPHSFHVSPAGPGRIIVVVSPGGFDQFVAAAGQPARDLRLPEPVPPDPVRLTRLAAAHGIQILPHPGDSTAAASWVLTGRDGAGSGRFV
jgi:hypothetical protein